MKKIAALILALFVAAALPLCADEFTEMIHVLAVKAASLGTYDASQVNVDYEIGNYYSPQIWVERFAAEYGSIAGERTFLGVCFDYATFSYNEIARNQRKYNSAGMNGDEFYMINANNSSTVVTVEKITTRENATVTYTSGTPVKRYGTRNILTHDEWNNKRASYHEWIWIQRDDGVWFWVDPTWTDNVGYVRWGYIANGEEITLKPDKKFCVEWRSHLDNLPDPPPRGPKIQPTYVAQTQKPSTSRPTSSYTPSTRSSYSSSYGYEKVISVGVSKPLADFMSGNYIGNSFWDTVSGVSISLEDGNAYSIVGLFQLDYYNLDTKSLILDFGLGKQLGSVLALYGGAGIGFGTRTERIADMDFDDLHLAWKAFVGARLTFGRIALRADVSYVKDTGFIVGAYAGWLFDN